MIAKTDPHRVAVLALDGVYPFELGIPSRLLGAAEGRYDIATCSADGAPVRTSADFTLEVRHGPEILDVADTVIIPSIDPAAIPDELPESVSIALSRIPSAARLVSICTGAFILAAAGFLSGRRATTHWQLAPLFAQRYPDVEVDPDVLFVVDGRILTSAGAASGIDTCLHIIRSDHGSALANTVARRCVVPPFRDGGQRQFIELPVPESETARTSGARTWALENLQSPLTLDVLARRSGMSVRTFSRRFVEEVGLSPAQWVIQQRIAHAQRLLEITDLPIEQIAPEVGLATSASLRQHFQAILGVSPRAYRNTFRGAAQAEPLSA